MHWCGNQPITKNTNTSIAVTAATGVLMNQSLKYYYYCYKCCWCGDEPIIKNTTSSIATTAASGVVMNQSARGDLSLSGGHSQEIGTASESRNVDV